MKGVLVVVWLSLAFHALCEGQGSGDDFVIITPSGKAAPSTTFNKATPPTDATNDSGSGVDDEDFGDGSGTSPSTTSSSVEPTTGFDDQASSGSGSGDFVPSKTDSTRAKTMSTDSTDMYISKTTTLKVTARVTSPTSDAKTTLTTDAVVQLVPSTPSSTNSILVDTTTEKPTQAVETKTTRAAVRMTTTEEVTSERETTQTKEQTETPTWENELPKSTVQWKTTMDPHVLNRIGKEDPGFTLTTEVIAGVVGCALLALLLIAFLMYRLKKRDEGSYLLDDPYDKKMGNSDKEAFV